MNEQLKLVKRLNELDEQRSELLRQLGKATLMQLVWPDAFDGGQRCTLKYHTKHDRYRGEKISLAFLERSDGEKYMLTRDELMRFEKHKSDIHREYEYRDTDETPAKPDRINSRIMPDPANYLYGEHDNDYTVDCYYAGRIEPEGERNE